MKKRRKNTSWWGPANRLLPALETVAVPKNTTGVMFERPGASWRHPGATKHTTGVVFGPSRAVLDSSGSFQERPTASKSVPEASRSVPERPGASWKPPGMSSRRFLDASRVTKNKSFVDPTPPASLQHIALVDLPPAGSLQKNCCQSNASWKPSESTQRLLKAFDTWFLSIWRLGVTSPQSLYNNVLIDFYLTECFQEDTYVDPTPAERP